MTAGPSEMWQQVLTRTLTLPGVAVERKSFLQHILTKMGCTEEETAAAAAAVPAAVLPESIIDKAAVYCLRRHAGEVTALSAAAGIPGGLLGAATVPADVLQYFWHVLVLAQKLAYLYGCQELTDKEGRLSPEGKALLTLFCGVMLGSGSAAAALKLLSVKFPGRGSGGEEDLKGLILSLIKDTSVWLGLKLTKKAAGTALTRLVPVVSALTAGALTLYSFYPQAKELLRKLKAHGPLRLPPPPAAPDEY